MTPSAVRAHHSHWDQDWDGGAAYLQRKVERERRLVQQRQRQRGEMTDRLCVEHASERARKIILSALKGDRANDCRVSEEGITISSGSETTLGSWANIFPEVLPSFVTTAVLQDHIRLLNLVTQFSGSCTDFDPV